MPTADVNALFAHARLAFVAGRFDEALAALEAVSAARPRDPMVHSPRASALRELGRLKEAAAAYEAVLAMAPRNAEAAAWRARLAAARGEVEAAEHYRGALADGGDPEGLAMLAAAVARRPGFW